MAQHKVITTDKQIDDAIRRAQTSVREPVARAVEYIPKFNLLLIGLSNGRRLVLPVEDLQGLERATHDQLENHQIVGHGTGISFPDLDVDLYVPALAEGVYGSRKWMAELESSRAHSSKTPAAA